MVYYKRLLSLLSSYKIYIILMSLLTLVSTLGNIIIPLLQQSIIDYGLIHDNTEALLYMTAITAVVILICKTVAYAQSVLQINMNIKFRRMLEMDVLKHSLRLKMAYIKKHGLLKLIKQANHCIGTIAELTGEQVVTALFEIFKFFGMLIGLLIISWRLTVFLLLLIPIRLLISTHFTVRAEAGQRQSLEAHGKIHKWEQDSSLGINEIKLWNLYETKEREYETLLKQRDAATKGLSLNIHKNEHLGSSIEELCVCGIYLLCGYFLFDRSLSIGGIITFITYARLLMQPVSVFVLMRIQLAQIKPALHDYDSFFLLETEGSGTPCTAGLLTESVCVNHITFNNVSFHFENRKILDSVSFSIYRGEKIAVVGENGAGKSTLLNLLLKFFIPDSGKILLNGVDIQTVAVEEYRDLFSVISQVPYLFDGSVKENLSMFGKVQWDNYSSQPLLSFISSLNDGEDTQIGNNSSQISGGEKQKIALFRSLYKSSRILIMDEPTSSYDIDSERAFADIMKNNGKDICIIITHDQALLEYADRILLLRNGCIEVYGSYQELVKSDAYTVIA